MDSTTPHPSVGFFSVPHIASNHRTNAEAGSSMRIIHDVHDQNSSHYLSIIYYIGHQVVVDQTVRKKPRR